MKFLEKWKKNGKRIFEQLTHLQLKLRLVYVTSFPCINLPEERAN